jgi:cell division protease FtsH
MDQLHQISNILIERETIDKDQFERLLAGEDEATVFPDESATETPVPSDEPKREPQQRRPRPFPLPGATMQPPPPDPAKG